MEAYPNVICAPVLPMTATPPSTKARTRTYDVAAALFVVAWLIGLFNSRHPGEFGFGHGFEMATIARNLLQHGSFADPFAPALTGPTAVVPPLYPILLAGLIKIFGWPLPAALILNIAANALTAGLLPLLALAFYKDARPGTFAGVFWILAMPLMPQWDVSITIFCQVLGCVITARTIARRGPGWHGGFAGVLAGIISLLNPLATLPFLAWIVFLLASRAVSRKDAVRYGTIVILGVVLCNLPWMLRNYRIWHALVLRTNFGMTVYSSNNDCAESSLGKSGQNGCYQQTHPVASDSEVRLMQKLGEVQYDRQRTSDTFAWIRSHPSRFATLTASRVVEFWFPTETISGAPLYSVWAATLLSSLGLIFMFLRRQAVAWFVLAVWAVYPLAYYIVVSSDRYRFPILWTSLLPAGYCVALLLARILPTRP